MGNIFGKAKKVSKVTEHDKAVLELKTQRDKLKQYSQKIVQSLEKERELAKKLLHEGKKDRAKLLLKKKRFQETQLQKSEAQLDNIEKLVQDLEFASIEVQVVEGLKRGNEALKKVNDMLSVEDIEKILDETREGIDKQKEIDELLSTNLSPEDLEEVETELEKIMEEENLTLPRDVSKLTPEAEDEDVSPMPEVPQTPLPDIPDEPEKVSTKRERVLVAA